MTPVLFVAHGAPLLVLEDHAYTRFLDRLGNDLGRPRAILIFSAHWESPVQLVSRVDTYSTIYDFYGFPDELYRIVYPAKGAPELADDIMQRLGDAGIAIRPEEERGLDHGAWVVLKRLYPNADVPVVAMSVNPHLPPAEQYRIGKALSDLRKRDVLIIASGGTVHNLAAVDMQNHSDVPEAWALEFENWLEDAVTAWDVDRLFRFRTLAPHAERAVPFHGQEHFIPLFYAMGAADDERKAELLHRSFRYGTLSQSVWRFGESS